MHPLRQAHGLDLLRGAAVGDDVAELRRHLDYFVHADTAEKAGVAAHLAAAGVVDGDVFLRLFAQKELLLLRRLPGLAAGFAQLAHQPLGDDAHDGIGQQVGFHAHVQQAGERGGGAVGVQGTDHKVARDGRLHGDGRGLIVADLADHDDVRVLAQDGAQRGGKGEVGLGVDLHLVDARDVGFHGVLDGDDVDAFLI